MKKIEEHDEIMNKIQRKIDKDIERMKSKKDMDKSVEKQIRKQLLDLYLFQSENDKKLEKQRKQSQIRFLNKNVEGYYTNDNLKYGPYKMLINCCENCFFTLNIAKGMIVQILIKNIGAKT